LLVTFACRHCNVALVVPDDLTGQYMICPICSGGNDIPDPPQMPFTGRAADYGVVELKCLNCGYNVEGLTDNLCPECGRRFTPAYLAKLAAKGPLKGPNIYVLIMWIVVLTSPCWITALFSMFD
jgi:RNA polymerase subunit RPABC4/transcription elongation factor Spt4